MAHHYKSDCKQCYRYELCLIESSDPIIRQKKQKAAQIAGSNFVKLDVESRKAYQLWWLVNDMPIGMGNHDCFKSIQQHEKESKTVASQQKTKQIQN